MTGGHSGGGEGSGDQLRGRAGRGQHVEVNETAGSPSPSDSAASEHQIDPGRAELQWRGTSGKGGRGPREDHSISVWKKSMK